jgi:hypothetical protein
MEGATPTSFRDREQAFEAKFAHDAELRFLVEARGDRLLAGWAADRLRSSTQQAEALIKQVLAIPNGPEHDRTLLRQIAELLAARRVGMSEQDLSAVLKECRQKAMQQLTETPPDHPGAN